MTLLPVTLVKIEVQESNLHQMNHKKVYFLTCFIQNIQNHSMVGCRALNERAILYGPPCRHTKKQHPTNAPYIASPCNLLKSEGATREDFSLVFLGLTIFDNLLATIKKL